jgi:hypothetical protein
MSRDQGCQIFLGATYQYGKKYTKRPHNIPTLSVAGPSKICPKCDFWFENIPSGNPVHERDAICRRQDCLADFRKKEIDTVENSQSRNWWLAFTARQVRVIAGVARFYLAQHTKTGRISQNDHKIYQVAIEYTKCH